MIALKYLLIVLADMMFVASFAIVINEVWLRLAGHDDRDIAIASFGWRKGIVVGALAWLPLLLAVAIAGRI
jgi:hypothetical protein